MRLGFGRRVWICRGLWVRVGVCMDAMSEQRQQQEKCLYQTVKEKIKILASWAAVKMKDAAYDGGKCSHEGDAFLNPSMPSPAAPECSSCPGLGRTHKRSNRPSTTRSPRIFCGQVCEYICHSLCVGRHRRRGCQTPGKRGLSNLAEVET